jgi:hypothetical protein
MKTLSVTIEGITPLICNKFSDAAAMRSSSGRTSSMSGSERETPLEISEKKLYIGLDGKPMIPGMNVFRCIVEGGRFHKVGKKQVTTLKNSVLYSCATINDVEVPIIHRQPWKVDTRAVRIPATGGRILAHRPMFDDWRLSFSIEFDEGMIGEKFMRDIFDDAGKRVGLGDFRPDCKGPYGKFVVTSWKVES